MHRTGSYLVGVFAAAILPALAAASSPAPPAGDDIAEWVTPVLNRWDPGQGSFELSSGARIVVSADRALQGEAAELRSDLRTLSGLDLPVAPGPPKAGDVVLQIKAHEHKRVESYTLKIDSQALIQGDDAAGVYYGTQTLLQLLKHSRDHRHLPRGAADDHPAVALRMVTIDAGRRFYEPSQLQRLMREMAWLKLNTLHLHLTDWPAFRLRSEHFPGLAASQAYGRDDIRRLEAAAMRYHITIIPEIDLPAHSSALLRYRPQLGFECESMRQSSWLTQAAGAAAPQMAWTVDITKPDNRAFLVRLLDEFIPWFSGPYFHIGGDEYQYDADKRRCPELMAAAKARGFPYPGDEFVGWINEADGVVRAHGKTTIIWNWWRFKDDATSIEPNKDIIIDTWNTPRLADILSEGYAVIVSPEETLYIDPGIESAAGDRYGIFDLKSVYETWSPGDSPHIKGYALAVWADHARLHTDYFMLGETYEPMAVMAERWWSDHAVGGIDAFLQRLNGVGAAPQSAAEH